MFPVRAGLVPAALCALLALPLATADAETPSTKARPDARLPELEDRRLDPGDRVLGVVVNDEPRAYALTELALAGGPVHDVVAGTKVDVVYEREAARIVGIPDATARAKTTNWLDWSSSHPDTSVWRVPAETEGELTRSVSDVRVNESRHYSTTIGCAMQPRLTSTKAEPPGLMVISGTIENVTPLAVHHVVLRYELLDATGKIVYRDEGYNRSAEPLAAPKHIDAGELVPLPGGGDDTFRMIFLAEELPEFSSIRVSVSRVY